MERNVNFRHREGAIYPVANHIISLARIVAGIGWPGMRVVNGYNLYIKSWNRVELGRYRITGVFVPGPSEIPNLKARRPAK